MHSIKMIMAIICTIIVSGNLFASPFSQVVVFGDSLSDTGNFASINGDLPPPFFNNRISNGPVAVEVLAQMLGMELKASLHLLGLAQGSNYAIAGAGASTDSPIDLSSQVNAFLSNHSGQAPGNALYILFIGGNDIRLARDSTWRESKTIVKKAVGNIIKQAGRLQAAGAKTFLFVNAPDLGRIPETLLLSQAQNKAFLPERTSYFSKLFNSRLKKALSRFEKKSDVNIVELDVFKFTRQMLERPDSYALLNVKEACFSSVNFIFHPDCGNGANFGRFFYFDEIHPTAKLHNRVARALYAVTPEFE